MASNMPGTQLPTRNVSGKTGSEITPVHAVVWEVGYLRLAKQVKKTLLQEKYNFWRAVYVLVSANTNALLYQNNIHLTYLK